MLLTASFPPSVMLNCRNIGQPTCTFFFQNDVSPSLWVSLKPLPWTLPPTPWTPICVKSSTLHRNVRNLRSSIFLSRLLSRRNLHRPPRRMNCNSSSNQIAGDLYSNSLQLTTMGFFPPFCCNNTCGTVLWMATSHKFLGNTALLPRIFSLK